MDISDAESRISYGYQLLIARQVRSHTTETSKVLCIPSVVGSSRLFGFLENNVRKTMVIQYSVPGLRGGIDLLHMIIFKRLMHCSLDCTWYM